jgi:hypothetical protein
MNTVNLFLNGTKDPIEKLYGSTITTIFPNYARFWLDFIGNPNYRVPKAFGLLYNSSISRAERERVNDIYQEICMAHYSLFCHLGGAQFQIDNLKKLGNSNIDSYQKYFEYWEAFEIGYFHFGCAFYQLYHLWGLFFLLKGEVVQNSPGNFDLGPKSLLINYLKNYNEITILAEMKKLDDSVKVLRDNIVHFSRGSSKYLNGEFLIPAEFERQIWSKKHKTKNWLETFRLINEHVIRIERLFDHIHLYLIVELKDYFEKKGIAVNYL